MSGSSSIGCRVTRSPTPATPTRGLGPAARGRARRLAVGQQRRRDAAQRPAERRRRAGRVGADGSAPRGDPAHAQACSSGRQPGRRASRSTGPADGALGDEWLFSRGWRAMAGASTLRTRRRVRQRAAAAVQRPQRRGGRVRLRRDQLGIRWGCVCHLGRGVDRRIPAVGGGDRIPTRLRVYFGHATDARGLTRNHAIDKGDLPEDGSVVDVKVAPTGRHLLVTAAYPLDGRLSVPPRRPAADQAQHRPRRR